MNCLLAGNFASVVKQVPLAFLKQLLKIPRGATFCSFCEVNILGRIVTTTITIAKSKYFSLLLIHNLVVEISQEKESKRHTILWSLMPVR